MKHDVNELQTRREFLRNTGRGAALAVLAAVTCVLVARAVSSGETCNKPSPCGGCAVFSNCGLPRAEAARNIVTRS